ncbi:MAG: integrase arm-type DNA-binding domain-containing protein [Hyphomicrobiales bacterium]|nr:integrase arm-type DNA-binding domain-containing protein [Amphiplicatus sp.]MCC2103941.1 integrase arm-type DNA-binding domain-containing protein [Hyphomicrobiales bacterium]MCC2108179.1 integrase arm-type DNA-binding domain-containing protein [Hyphomicrobiales bacterium]
MAGKLSARRAETLKEPGLHGDGDGLYLSIGEGGARSWLLFFRWKGRRREMGLGSARHVSLAEARELARAARTRIRAGVDPIAEKRRPAGMTFGDAADALIESMAAGWRNSKHEAQWRMTLKDYCATIRLLPVEAIETEDVLRVLRPIWQTKTETAARLRGRIERVLDFAKARGLRQGENPARWKGHLDHLLARPKKLSRGHHKAMPFDDLPAFMPRLRAAEGGAAKALEFVILTAARTGEALGAEWCEIDFEAKVWTVPADRMKAGREHRVPLGDRALEILKPLHEARTGDLIFPGSTKTGRLSDMTLTAVLRRLGVDATVHGFRSSFRDWAGERTTFPREVAEAALAHRVGNEVELAYRRGDALEKRRKLMVAWERFIAAPVAGNVVRLGA